MSKRLGLALFLVVSLWAAPASATITFFGVASTPADGGSNTTKPAAITPPASMVVGDFAWVTFRDDVSNDPANMSVSTTGGQTWSTCTSDITATSQTSARCWYARFNGTWDANPAFTTSASGAIYTAIMVVMRPTASACTWAVDNAGVANNNIAADTTDLTITGVTRAGASSVAIAQWEIKDMTAAGGPAFSDLQGAGWSKSGLAAQYRNIAGGDMGGSIAYSIGTGATGNVSQDQTSNTVWATWIGSFAETCPASGPPLGTLGLLGAGR